MTTTKQKHPLTLFGTATSNTRETSTTAFKRDDSTRAPLAHYTRTALLTVAHLLQSHFFSYITRLQRQKNHPYLSKEGVDGWAKRSKEEQPLLIQMEVQMEDGPLQSSEQAVECSLLVLLQSCQHDTQQRRVAEC
jgi:hypothetical protein